ncbi:MAG: radical SAM protein [Anaerolineae bacterium]|nr:radical SAM protein [Anaerolineae bacterium]
MHNNTKDNAPESHVECAAEGQCDCACAVPWPVAIDSRMTPFDHLKLDPITLQTATQLRSAQATPLVAWLQMTDACNLSCDYCYRPHSNQAMSFQRGQAIVDAVVRSANAHGYTRLKLKYAGGEPLLRLPTVLDLHRYATVLARHHGLTLEGVVLSNGTLLTAAMVQQLKSAHLRLMLSLDGLGEYHNAQRHFPDGTGTAQLVINAIHMAVAGGVSPDISITVSDHNAAGLADVVAWVLRENLAFSLNLCRNHANCAQNHTLQLDPAIIIAAMRQAYKAIENHLPQRSLLTSIADHANLAMPHLYPCSAGRDYLVFDTQGKVAKCQMDITSTVTDYLDPDPLAAIRSDHAGWTNLAVTEKPTCRACRWRFVCSGGCPLQAYHMTGSAENPSPNCAIYKALFPQVIQLEALRQMKSLRHS